MKITNKNIDINTKEKFEFIDLTNDIKNFVGESQIKNGIVNIQLLNTSAGLIVNENEPLLLEDLKNKFRNTAPENASYNHDDFKRRTVNLCQNECVNGDAHCNAINLLVSATLNLIDGKLQLGHWQSVMLVELDNSRKRTIQIQIIGEPQ